MKQRLLIGFLVGVLLLTILLAEIGISPTLDVALAAGPVLLLLIPLHFMPLLFDTLGWHALLLRTVPLGRLLWIAVVREAVGRLLPVANTGGELAGLRLLLKTASVDAPTAIVSVIAETLLTVIARSLFVAIGAICLLEAVPQVDWLMAFLISLGAVLLIGSVIGLVRVYRLFFSSLIQAAEQLFPGRVILLSLMANSTHLYEAIGYLRSSPAPLSLALAWQLAALLIGTAETWLALRWFGKPTDLLQAMALESLTQAVRQVVIIIPAGLGVQELGLVTLGHVLGLDGPTALALSAVKRLRELAIGVPGLLVLYLVDGRQALLHPGSGAPR